MTAIRSTLVRMAPCVCAAATALLGACVAPVQAPAPAPATRALPPPPLARSPAPTDWHDLPASLGVWRWRREGRSSVARFGDPPQPALFSLTCDPLAGTVNLTRSWAGGGATTMVILTTSLSRTLAARPGSGSVVAVLSARDPLLDAIAYSRGRFAVQVPGVVPLYLPSWPEVSRVIEDCR